MYIDKLTVKDIASLRGQHTVDFKNMLAKEGLFAITGPTGSGKSSLLSAISLALYGQGAKKGLAAKDYVSEGATGAEVNLIFTIESRTYRAFWSCTVLKKDGTPRSKPITKSFIEDLHTSEVLEVGASDLIKLTLDQFNQCVVLHQGEFAKFLTSTFSERRVILEKLVNIAELEHLKESFVSKYHILDKEIAALKEKAQSSEIFSKEEHLELLTKKDTSSQAHQRYTKQLASFSEIGRFIEKIIEYKKIIDETKVKEQTASSALEVLVSEYQEVFEEYQKLELSHRTLEQAWHKERPDIIKSIENNRKIESQQAEVKREQSEIAELKTRALSLEQKQKALETQLSEITFEWTLDERELLAKEGENILREIDELGQNRELHSKLMAEYKAYQAQMGDLTDQANELKSKYTLLTEEELTLKKQELLGLEQQQESHNQDKIACENKIKRLNELATKQQEKLLAIANLSQSNIPTDQIEKDLLKKQDELTERQLLLNQYETIEELWQKTLELGTCQLCGHDHPSTPHLPLEGKEKLIQKVDEIKLALSEYRQELTKAKESESKLVVLKAESARLQEEIKELTGREDQGPSALVDHLQAKLKESVSQIKANQEKRQQLDALLSEEGRLKNTLAGYREQYARAKESSALTLQKSKELDQVCSEILKKKSFNHFVKSTSIAELSSEYLSQLRGRLYKEITLIQKASHLENSLTEIKAQIAKDRERCDSRERRVQEYKAIIQSLVDQIPQGHKELDLNKHLESKDQEVKAKRDDLWNLGQKLNEKKLSSERSREAIGHIRENLKSAREWLSKHSQEYTKAAKHAASYFDDQDELTSAVAKFVVEHFDVEHMGHEQIKTLHEGDYLPLKQALERKKDSAHTEFVQIKSKLDLYDNKMKEVAALTVQLKKREAKFALMNSMKDFFWRNDFKNFVLSMIEEELIFITNDELAKLCEGRYQLSSKGGPNGPEFVVIDKWISLTERKVASLSGGETFMVSLALALGLAEMTRGKTQIDSFFIDEGFGSLDSETLDSVTEVLLGLRGRGKTIGIISHVEALTARLPRSLILSKHTGGQSTLAYQELV